MLEFLVKTAAFWQRFQLKLKYVRFKIPSFWSTDSWAFSFFMLMHEHTAILCHKEINIQYLMNLCISDRRNESHNVLVGNGQSQFAIKNPLPLTLPFT
jgi:hypothetical protein